MTESHHRVDLGWIPSVYYAESLVNCSLQSAWGAMLDYEAWNPDFRGSEVVPVRGEPRSEGELVLIRLFDANRVVLWEYYAETIKVVPRHHFVWHVYPKVGDSFSSFVDFSVEEAAGGVRFRIQYYAQNQLAGDALKKQREESEISFRNLTSAFKKYCEAK